MLLRLTVLKSAFNSYSTSACSLLFLFMAVIYLLIKNKKSQQSLLIYQIFGILLLVIPFIGNKILTLKTEGRIDWPIYGILCVIPMMAYIVTELLQGAKSKKDGFVLFAVFLVTVQLGFGFDVTGEQFFLPQNMKKISTATMDIAEKLDEAEWHIMAPAEMAGELREYSTNIHVLYKENYLELQQNLGLLLQEAAAYGGDCIILNTEYDNAEVMIAGGYVQFACVEDYVIYIKDS